MCTLPQNFKPKNWDAQDTWKISYNCIEPHKLSLSYLLKHVNSATKLKEYEQLNSCARLEPQFMHYEHNKVFISNIHKTKLKQNFQSEKSANFRNRNLAVPIFHIKNTVLEKREY